MARLGCPGTSSHQCQIEMLTGSLYFIPIQTLPFSRTWVVPAPQKGQGFRSASISHFTFLKYSRTCISAIANSSVIDGENEAHLV